MAIRRISELDLFTNADLSQFLSTEGVADSSTATMENVPDPLVYDFSKLSVGLWFEVSTPRSGLSCIDEDKNTWIVKPVNEANSYYLSKKINVEDFSKMFMWRYEKFMSNVLCGPINYYGSQNFGEGRASLIDGVDTVWYDDRPGTEENPNRLCVMIYSDFTNQVTFHNNVDFHGANGHIQIHRENTNEYRWNGRTINLQGPWMDFDKDIVVDGSAYIKNLTVINDIDGTCLRAKWADIAENYETDACYYSPGTLVEFGGEEEITLATKKANAVISDKPGVLLDSSKSFKNNLPIALVGKTPVRVIGKVKKFDKIGLSKIPGVGAVVRRKNHIGIALESSDEEGEKLVNCVVQLSI